MKKELVFVSMLIVTMLLTACSSVRTWDGNGKLTGVCKARGIGRAASCAGFANSDMRVDQLVYPK